MRIVKETNKPTDKELWGSTNIPHSQVHFIKIGVTIKTWPLDECTLFNYAAAKHKMKRKNITVEKTNELRMEVVTQGLIRRADTSDLYTIRFVHPRTIEEARKLKPGQYITVLAGRFNPRHGRKGMEFIVKDFTI